MTNQVMWYTQMVRNAPPLHSGRSDRSRAGHVGTPRPAPRQQARGGGPPGDSAAHVPSLCCASAGRRQQPHQPGGPMPCPMRPCAIQQIIRGQPAASRSPDQGADGVVPAVPAQRGNGHVHGNDVLQVVAALELLRQAGGGAGGGAGRRAVRGAPGGGRRAGAAAPREAAEHGIWTGRLAVIEGGHGSSREQAPGPRQLAGPGRAGARTWYQGSATMSLTLERSPTRVSVVLWSRIQPCAGRGRLRGVSSLLQLQIPFPDWCGTLPQLCSL